VASRRLDLQIDRLFWRAGFGPSPADRRRARRDGLHATRERLLHGHGGLRGAPPRIDGGPLYPYDRWGHDVLWWLDRMVRTTAPLAELMAFNLHDHFATSNDKVGDARLMVAQYRLLRRYALGNFRRLAHAIGRDHAMHWWLDVLGSNRHEPNENFARELIELFTLGVGHYSERDIREAARAFTGYDYDWGRRRYFWNPDNHDGGVKTIFGHRGRFRPDDVIELCLRHPAHAPYLTTKLWSYFVPTPPSASTARRLVRAYRASGCELRPVLRLILASGAFNGHLTEPDMIKPPVVYTAGMLRAIHPRIDTDAWTWLLGNMGQQPFYPPNVAGWPMNEDWLTTLSGKARVDAAAHLLGLKGVAFPDTKVRRDERPTAAYAWAVKSANHPWLSPHTAASLRATAASIRPAGDWDHHAAAERRRVLRLLLLAGPDGQVC